MTAGLYDFTMEEVADRGKRIPEQMCHKKAQGIKWELDVKLNLCMNLICFLAVKGNTTIQIDKLHKADYLQAGIGVSNQKSFLCLCSIENLLQTTLLIQDTGSDQ